MNEQIMQPGRVVSRWIAAGIMVLSIGSCEEVPTAESETVETTQLLYNGGAEEVASEGVETNKRR